MALLPLTTWLALILLIERDSRVATGGGPLRSPPRLFAFLESLLLNIHAFFIDKLFSHTTVKQIFWKGLLRKKLRGFEI